MGAVAWRLARGVFFSPLFFCGQLFLLLLRAFEGSRPCEQFVLGSLWFLRFLSLCGCCFWLFGHLLGVANGFCPGSSPSRARLLLVCLGSVLGLSNTLCHVLISLAPFCVFSHLARCPDEPCSAWPVVSVQVFCLYPNFFAFSFPPFLGFSWGFPRFSVAFPKISLRFPSGIP